MIKSIHKEFKTKHTDLRFVWKFEVIQDFVFKTSLEFHQLLSPMLSWINGDLAADLKG